MQWHMFILYPDNDLGEINIKNLIRDLSQRHRELYHRDGEFPHEFKVYRKEASGDERHYFFTPKVAELAGDILDTYGVFIVAPPESIDNMRQIVL